MDAVKPIEQAAKVLVITTRVRDPEDLEVALPEHSAAVARASDFDRTIGWYLSFVRALRSQLKAEPLVVLLRRLEIGRHESDVIQCQ
jgi:hypothetical protein